MEIFEDLPGWAKLLAGTVGGLSASFLFLRQYLSSAATARASDAAQVEAIGVYKDMVFQLRDQLAEANRRADEFAKERTEAYKLLGKYEGQIQEMARQLEIQSSEIRSLREKLENIR